MLEQNVKFMDLYKSVDRFIRDAYRTSEGVSEYLRQMEAVDYKGDRLVPRWKEDYDTLKHVRWVRNQLAHDVSYDSDICEAADLVRLQAFYERLYSANDPLALLKKEEEADRQRQQENRRRRIAAQRERQKQAAASPPEQRENIPAPPVYRKTLWQRIREFFSGK